MALGASTLTLACAANLLASPVRAETTVPPELEARVEAGRDLIEQVIEKVAQVGKRERVEAAFKEAHGFAVFVDVRQAGIMVSQLSGHGMLAFRDREGEWNPPVILRVEGTSFGPHMRAQSGDTLVLLKTPGAVERFFSAAGTRMKRGTETSGPAQEIAV
jgi:lipid-binding SYLF domain-containing protein